MKSTQQPRTSYQYLTAYFTCIAVLWHILYAPMVNLGWIPALYAMPSHCRMVTANDLGHQTHSKLHHPTQPHVMHLTQHVHQKKSLQQTHTIVLHQHTSINASKHVMHAKAAKNTFAQWQQDAFNLATDIMQLCPLCSLGLTGLLLPLFVLLFVVLITKKQHLHHITSRSYTIWSSRFIKFLMPPHCGPPTFA